MVRVFRKGRQRRARVDARGDRCFDVVAVVEPAPVSVSVFAAADRE